LDQIRGALFAADIKVKGLPDDNNLPEINENGKTPAENARIKALAYSKIFNEPVFSMDNALYIDGLPPEDQPGLNVRRIKGSLERPTDRQLLEYYTNLISSLGKEVKAYWSSGMCIAAPDGRFQEITIKSPRIFVSKPSRVIVEGYPLESIQIDPSSKKYISELTQKERDIFWQSTIGKPLLAFVQSVDL
jgi:inosine/xanthosine triphosphate pyrophosphatase family protein